MRAFSLTEALLTAAILGILMAIAVPTLKPAVDRQRVEVELARVVEFVAAAADRARARRAPVDLTVAPRELSDGDARLHLAYVRFEPHTLHLDEDGHVGTPSELRAHANGRALTLRAAGFGVLIP